MHSTGVLHRVSRGHDGWQGFAGTWASGATGWTPVDLFGSQLISGTWYPKSAQGVVTIEDTVTPTYYVAYTCIWNGSKWMCGCRDAACTQSYWQIQSFKR